MKEQTIYHYQLLYRFRWKLSGYLLQLICLGGLLYGSTRLFPVQLQELFVSLSILVLLPILHVLFFRLYAYCVSTRPKLSPDMLFCPWWGSGTAYPATLGFFRAAETTVCLGSICVPAALFVWIPQSYAIDFLAGGLVLALPRIVGLFHSLRQPKHCRIKYETRSIAFLLTEGYKKT